MKMRHLVPFAVACVLVGGLARAQTKPPGGFEQFKSLVGEWEAPIGDGQTARASYRLVSGGTALLEQLVVGSEPEMVTMYTADGERVALTHYCNAGNQPHMCTPPITRASKVFSFNFVRATNLSDPDAGHMDHLLVTLLDKDHFSQAWTWKEKGKTTRAIFKFTRKS